MDGASFRLLFDVCKLRDPVQNYLDGIYLGSHHESPIMRNFLRVIFGLNVIFLAMLALSFPTIEPGTGAFVVTGLSLIVIFITMIASGVLLYIDWDPSDDEHWQEHLEDDESRD